MTSYCQILVDRAIEAIQLCPRNPDRQLAIDLLRTLPLYGRALETARQHIYPEHGLETRPDIYTVRRQAYEASLALGTIVQREFLASVQDSRKLAA